MLLEVAQTWQACWKQNLTENCVGIFVFPNKLKIYKLYKSDLELKHENQAQLVPSSVHDHKTILNKLFE